MTISFSGAPSFGGTHITRFGNLPQAQQASVAAAAPQFGHGDSVHFGMRRRTLAAAIAAVPAALALTACGVAQGNDGTSTQAQGKGGNGGGDAVAVQPASPSASAAEAKKACSTLDEVIAALPKEANKTNVGNNTSTLSSGYLTGVDPRATAAEKQALAKALAVGLEGSPEAAKAMANLTVLPITVVHTGGKGFAINESGGLSFNPAAFNKDVKGSLLDLADILATYGNGDSAAARQQMADTMARCA
jgi:hypothetical protein